jgi:tRNA threonylcarbamoyladenosine biosynthesis protein TsaE
MVKTSQEVVVVEGRGLASLQQTAKQLLDLATGTRIWLIQGDMGAGKTTLIKYICGLLEVEDLVSSPTFSIINEYKSAAEPIYHFDFYRVKTLQEALQAGVEDYFYSGHYCFIEWPELIKPVLPKSYLNLNIEVAQDEIRKYKLSLYGIN